jgi:AcrR family transcriptional regulator
MRRGADQQSDSRQRLLRVAEELFGLVGFRRATVREICERARVNNAMVNYYFGGKEGLYRAVLEFSLTESLRKPHAKATLETQHAGPEERLRAFITEFLMYALANEPTRTRTARLIIREMAEPSEALRWVVDTLIRPVADDVETLVREFLGTRASDEDIRWYAHSIIGQCLHYRSQRPALDHMYPDQKLGPEEARRLADHITRFSLGGLRSFHTP